MYYGKNKIKNNLQNDLDYTDKSCRRKHDYLVGRPSILKIKIKFIYYDAPIFLVEAS